MGIEYRNLDEGTRKHMLEESRLGEHYMSPRLTEAGLKSWQPLLEEAMLQHNDDWLGNEILRRGYIREAEAYTRNCKSFQRKINQPQAAQQLAEGEFNRYYLRGLCILANAAGIASLVNYRGKQVSQPRPESEAKIGTTIGVDDLLTALRINDFVSIEAAIGVPGGPNSGLTARLP